MGGAGNGAFGHHRLLRPMEPRATRDVMTIPCAQLRLMEPAWQLRLGQLARAIGTDQFHEQLLAAYGALIGYDSGWIIRYSRHAAPDVRFTINVPLHVLDLYQAGYYKDDPFHRFWARSPRPGVVRLGQVLPADDRTYSEGFQAKARFVDEMAMILPVIGHTGLALFLQRAEMPFSVGDEAVSRLVFPCFEGFHRAHMGRLFYELRNRTEAAEHAVIQLPTLILDRGGVTVFVNAAWRDAERSNPTIREAMDHTRHRDAPQGDGVGVQISPCVSMRVETFDDNFPLAPGGRMFVLETAEAIDPVAERLETTLHRLHQDGAVTPRELDILGLMMRGKTTGEIAQALAVSKGTIKNHRLRMYRKFNVTSERALMTSLMSPRPQASAARA